MAAGAWGGSGVMNMTPPPIASTRASAATTPPMSFLVRPSARPLATPLVGTEVVGRSVAEPPSASRSARIWVTSW